MALSDREVEELLRTAEERLSENKSKPKDSSLEVVPSQGQTESSAPAQLVKDDKLGAKLEPRVVSAVSGEKKKPDSAGPAWFNLPKTNLTPQLKRDLQVLRLRGALDPKQHYKKSAAKSMVPRYCHVGEVKEGPTEFYSARLTKRERKGTFADEVLGAAALRHRSKNKYVEIQEKKTSGKKGYYKALRKKKRY